MPTPDEQRVRTLIESWAHAISTEDRPAILAHHSADLLMFDFPPSIIRGLDGSHDRTWDFFFESPRGPIVFDPSDLEVVASEDVAFASCLIHCDGTSAGPLDLRLTVGLRKIDGDWTVSTRPPCLPARTDSSPVRPTTLADAAHTDPFDPVPRPPLYLANLHAADTAVDVTAVAHRHGGGAAAYSESGLLRALNDALAVQRHYQFAHEPRINLGRALTGVTDRYPPYITWLAPSPKTHVSMRLSLGGARTAAGLVLLIGVHVAHGVAATVRSPIGTWPAGRRSSRDVDRYQVAAESAFGVVVASTHTAGTPRHRARCGRPGPPGAHRTAARVIR